MKDRQLNINEVLFKLLIVAIFILPQEIRGGVLGESLGIINILAIILLFFIYKYNIKNSNTFYIICFYLTLVVYVFLALFYERSLVKILKSIFFYFFPLGLGLIRINLITFKKIFKFMLKILNIIIILIIFIGVLRFIFNIDLNIFISKLMTNRMKELIYNQQFSNVYRLYSFMGHPLFNTELILMFFILNSIWFKYFKEKDLPIWILIVSMIGISLTASKTGMILMVLATIFLFRNNNKVNKIILLLLVTFIAYKLGLFNSVIERFTEGSLTTGRSEKWIEVQAMGEFPIKFFTGYGNGFTFILNRYIDWASAAFEYPIRMFSLEFGVLTSVLIYYFIMIIPIITFIKRKQFFLGVSFMIIFVDVNTFNGLALNGDYMLIFCFFIFLIMNISNCIRIKEMRKLI